MPTPDEMRAAFPDLAFIAADWTDKVVVVSGNIEQTEHGTFLAMIEEAQGFGARAFLFLHPGTRLDALTVEHLEQMLADVKAGGNA